MTLNIKKLIFMKLQLIALLFILCSISTDTFANGGNDKNSLGARAAAMGGSAVATTGLYSLFSNQAGLAQLDGVHAGIYAENRFLMSELSMYAFGAAIPTKSGTFGLGGVYFGNSLYNERNIKLTYGRKLFKNFRIGAEFDIAGISISEYGSKTAITFGLGLQYDISPDVTIGAQIYNPLRVQLTDLDDDLLPTLITVGASYRPTEKITLLAEAEKNMAHTASFKGGIEYQVVKALYLRAGYSSAPSQTTFGVGVNLKAVKIDLAGSFHPVLGYSPHISIYYGKGR